MTPACRDHIVKWMRNWEPVLISSKIIIHRGDSFGLDEVVENMHSDHRDTPKAEIKEYLLMKLDKTMPDKERACILLKYT